MKPKFYDVLAVSSITLTFLFPAFVTFGLVWYHHLQFVHYSLDWNALSTAMMLILMSLFLLFPVWTAYQAYQFARFKQKVAQLERILQQTTIDNQTS